MNIQKTSTGILEPQTMVEFLIENGGSPSASDILKQLVEADLASDEKRKMNDGINYYRGDHDILKKKRYFFNKLKEKVEDPTKANNKVVNNFHAFMVDEKIGYINGDHPTIKTENETLETYLNDNFKNDFFSKLDKVIENCSNAGKSYLYVYMSDDFDENGKQKFGYSVFDSREIIAIRDTTPERNLTDVIRYYNIERVTTDEKGKLRTKEILKVEWYKPEGVVFYIENETTGELELDPGEIINPFPYRVNVTIVDGEINFVSGSPWGGIENPKLPIIEIRNNSQCQTDLERIKSLQDAYNHIESGFFDTLDDVAEVIKVIKGFAGSDAGEMAENLRYFHLIGVDAEGGIDALEINIPYEARKFALEAMERKIYELGQSVGRSSDKFGDGESGVALKFRYSGLDLKANKLINSLNKMFRELMFFFVDHLQFVGYGNFDAKEATWKFNKSMIFNETEKIQNALASGGVPSRETALSMHPAVKDVQKELEIIEEEEANQQEKSLAIFNSTGSNEE